MTRYANQKQITTKKVKAGDGKPYIILDNDNALQALAELSPVEFKLWFYLSKNLDNYTYCLSQADVETATGLSKSTYHRCMKNFEEKGFLYKPNPEVNNWVFTQTPKSSIQKEYSQKEYSQGDTNLYSERDFKVFTETQTSIQDEERNNKYTNNNRQTIESSQSQSETGNKYLFDWD